MRLIAGLIGVFTVLTVISTSAQVTMLDYSSTPLAFTENRGQFDNRVVFKAEVNGAAFYFCKDEVAYLFVRSTGELIKDDIGFPDGLPDDFPLTKYEQEALLI